MKHKNHPRHKRQQLTIIAGKFRHRSIHFIDTPDLRPTGARIRETLFNWLQPIIADKTCLDLFAGSGILGFEALSRGAKHTTFIEKNQQAAQQLKNNCQQLDITNANVVCGHYRSGLNSQYNVVFLDPPYGLRWLPNLLDEIQIVSPEYIFIEDNQAIEPWLQNHVAYRLIKSKKAGGIYYGLLQSIQA